MRRLALIATMTIAALPVLASPAAAHHTCGSGERPVHLYNPLTGNELVWTCTPSMESRPLIEDCPPGQSGTVINPPFLDPIYICEGP